MIIAMVQIKHRHGHVNLRVPRATNQQFVKAEQRNTSLIDDPGILDQVPDIHIFGFYYLILYINKFVTSHGIGSRSTITEEGLIKLSQKKETNNRFC